MTDTSKFGLRYVLGLTGSGLLALGGVLGITAQEFWVGTGVILAFVVADVAKHRND